MRLKHRTRVSILSCVWIARPAHDSHELRMLACRRQYFSHASSMRGVPAPCSVASLTLRILLAHPPLSLLLSPPCNWQDATEKDNPNKVTLTTIHQAKGLEWKAGVACAALASAQTNAKTTNKY